MPRFASGVPVTLGYVRGGSQKPHLIEPYPNYSWHSSNGEKCDKMSITSAIRVAIDKFKRLWVLDTGKIGDNFKCDPQLLIFNLKDDTVLRRHVFDKKVFTAQSLLVNPVSDYVCLEFGHFYQMIFSDTEY
jgi:Major royal jelly protein